MMRTTCCFMVVLSCYVIYVSGFTIRHVFGNRGIRTSDDSAANKRDTKSPGETYIFGHGRKRSPSIPSQMQLFSSALDDEAMLDQRSHLRFTPPQDEYAESNRVPDQRATDSSHSSRLIDEFMVFLSLKEQGLLDVCLSVKR